MAAAPQPTSGQCQEEKKTKDKINLCVSTTSFTFSNLPVKRPSSRTSDNLTGVQGRNCKKKNPVDAQTETLSFHPSRQLDGSLLGGEKRINVGLFAGEQLQRCLAEGYLYRGAAEKLETTGAHRRTRGSAKNQLANQCRAENKEEEVPHVPLRTCGVEGRERSDEVSPRGPIKTVTFSFMGEKYLFLIRNLFILKYILFPLPASRKVVGCNLIARLSAERVCGRAFKSFFAEIPLITHLPCSSRPFCFPGDLGVPTTRSAKRFPPVSEPQGRSHPEPPGGPEAAAPPSFHRIRTVHRLEKSSDSGIGRLFTPTLSDEQQIRERKLSQDAIRPGYRCF